MTSINNTVSAVSFAYDATGRLVLETQAPTGLAPLSFTIGYAYDADGNLVQTTYPSGLTLNHSYDARQQLTALAINGTAPLATFGYDYRGNRTARTYSNGTTASYTHDSSGRLTVLNHSAGSVSLAGLTYGYSAAGQRTSKAMTGTALPGGPRTESYTYDAAQQVTAVNYGNGRNQTFAYDPMGNWTGTTDTQFSNLAFLSNSLNQYTAGTLQGQLLYDANGNLIRHGLRQFTYTSDNRLVGANVLTNSTMSVQYDALGRKVSQTVNGQQVFYIHKDWHLIEERNPAGTLERRYIHGPWIDEILRMDDATGDYFVHQDGLGSAIALTNAAGALAETYRYDAFGRVYLHAPDGSTRSSSAHNFRFLFTGRESVAFGLYDYRNRYYSPTLGRWLSRDPIEEEGGLNLYGYVGNDPVNYIDPLGLYNVLGFEFTDGGGVGGFLSDLGDYMGAGLIGASEGAQVWFDEMTPFVDPFADSGFGTYDPCDERLAPSHFFGSLSQNAALTATGLRAGAWLGSIRSGHLLNHNRYLRIGPGRMPRNGNLPSGNDVPRVSVGPQRSGRSNPHFDLRTGS